MPLTRPRSTLALLAIVVGVCACGDGVPRAPGDELDGGGVEEDAGPTDAGSADAGPPACGVDTWGNFAQDVIATECIACHNHSHNFSNSYQSVKNNRTSMRRDVVSGAMPRTPQALTTDQRTRLVKWFDCGLPQ